MFKFSIHQPIFLKSFQVCSTVIIITMFFLSESGGESIYGRPFKVVCKLLEIVIGIVNLLIFEHQVFFLSEFIVSFPFTG